jgi:hypothetical protein
MREAQGWSGRTSPRIGPLSTRPHTSFSPGRSSHGFTPDAAPPPRSQQRGAASRITPPRAVSTAMGRATNAVRYHATRERITP